MARIIQLSSSVFPAGQQKPRAPTAGIARSVAALRQRHGVASVLSFDAAFDRVPGLTRLR